MIISRTPLRVSFLGGGSDLPGYYRRRGGAVLSTAIDQSVYITVSRKFDNAVRVSYSHTEEVAHASEVAHPLVREALAVLGIAGGIEITSIADIPAKGTGLGSSSAFTVGLLNALHAYCGRHASAEKLALESCAIEIERCGEPIGKQDQYAAAFGGFNFIRFHADERVEVNRVVCAPSVIAGLQERLLFFFTGITRSASELLARQSQEMAADAGKQDGMADMVRLAESAYAELCAGHADSLGEMLHDAWQIKKRMTNGISNAMVDDAYQAAIDAGAKGGKLLGAGGGGFLMLYAEPAQHGAIRRALARLRETPFSFAAYGSSIIFVHG
jgi:D-glycero-alpha-D-manno-heptose-7-phosphate kinase